MSNYNLLSKSNTAQATHLTDRFVPVQDANGYIQYKQHNYYSVNDKRIISSVQPQTQIPANLSNAVMDFKLENGLCDVINFVNLEWNLLNGTGAPSTFTASPLWIQRLDAIAQNGAVIYSAHGQELYQNKMFLDRDTYEAVAATHDLSATTYAPLATSLANGASMRFNLCVYGFFKATRLALSCIDGPLTVRFYYNPSSIYLASGSDCACTSMALIVHGRRLKDVARKELMNVYHNGKIPLSLSHLSVDRQTVTMALQASQTINITLTGLRGTCAFLTFTIRLASTANTAAGVVTYLASDSFDILDSNSASLIGHLQRNRNIQRIHWAESFGNNAMIQTGLNFISWANNPREAFATGANSGYAIFTGSETLRITLPSTITTNSHIIDITGYMYESVQFSKDGGVKAIRD